MNIKSKDIKRIKYTLSAIKDGKSKFKKLLNKTKNKPTPERVTKLFEEFANDINTLLQTVTDKLNETTKTKFFLAVNRDYEDFQKLEPDNQQKIEKSLKLIDTMEEAVKNLLKEVQ